MKTRFRFTKTGSIKFIGHLDCMRFFQKAIRRASLDVAYSEGFSPHQKMSFASPLGVGVTSDGEYIDIEFNSLEITEKSELIEYFNKYLSDEIYVTDFEIMPDDFKNSMALLDKADYMIVEKEAGIFPNDLEKLWESFICEEKIIVTKKTKKSVKEMDIKPYIFCYDFSLDSFSEKTKENYLKNSCEYDGKKIFLQLKSGSEINIKPELVLDAFFEHCNIMQKKYSLQVHRLQMYFK